MKRQGTLLNMRVSLKKLFAVVFLSASLSASAQTQVETWTYLGGGLDPATYGGDYLPTQLFADGFTGGIIDLTGFTSGGLGSVNVGAYEGLYTFTSTSPVMTLSATNLLAGVDQITFSFIVGGGFPAFVYEQSSLTLNWNAENGALVSSTFGSQSVGMVYVPVLGANLEMIAYTWTWTNLQSFGPSTEFSISWDTGGSQHVFFQEFSLTQTVPEPSIVGLIALGGTVVLMQRRRRVSAAS